MTLVHSNENLSSLAANTNEEKCTVCAREYEIDDLVVATPCSHIFHRDCIVEVLKETQACPVCGKACRPAKLKSHVFLAGDETQATSNPTSFNANVSNKGAIPKTTTMTSIRRNLLETEMTKTPAFNRNSDVASIDRLLNISSKNSPNVHQNFDAPDMSDNALQILINEAVRSQLESLNLNSNLGNRTNPDNSSNYGGNNYFRGNRNNNFDRGSQHRNPRASLGNTGFNNNNPQRLLGSRPNLGNTNVYRNYDLTTDRVSQIISGWHLKFSGREEDGLSVDNFIYRVQALTNQGLRGDFDLLCKHVHLLFCGKAIDWFWRFHRNTTRLDWTILCDELRNEFCDSRTDYDLKEQIRNRKQRNGEKFDLFYDALLRISDGLQQPISNFELIEILKRNLRPDVRKELLYLDINSISQLREYVRKHEILEEEINKCKSNKIFVPRKVVSELETEFLDDNIGIEEIKDLSCWNCSQKGHRFEDCLSERKIFCYGCGKPNVFKPNCLKCNKYSKNYQPSLTPKQLVSKSTQM